MKTVLLTLLAANLGISIALGGSLGMIFTKHPGQKLVIVGVIDDGPADRAGVRVNDTFDTVNGESVLELDNRQTLQKLRTPQVVLNNAVAPHKAITIDGTNYAFPADSVAFLNSIKSLSQAQSAAKKDGRLIAVLLSGHGNNHGPYNKFYNHLVNSYDRYKDRFIFALPLPDNQSPQFNYQVFRKADAYGVMLFRYNEGGVQKLELLGYDSFISKHGS